MSNESDPGHLLPVADWAKVVAEAEAAIAARKAAEAAAQKDETA